MNLTEIIQVLFVFALTVDTVLAAVFIALTIKHVCRNHAARATVHGAVATLALLFAAPGWLSLQADLSHRYVLQLLYQKIIGSYTCPTVARYCLFSSAYRSRY